MIDDYVDMQGPPPSPVADEKKEKVKGKMTALSMAPLLTTPSRRGVGGAIPPVVPLWPINKLTLRSRATATIAVASTGAITIGDIFAAIGGIGRVVNTSLTLYATSFRVKKVRIYPPNSSAGVGNTEVVWFSGDDREPDFAKVRTVQAYQAVPFCVVSAPPPKSTAAFWYRDQVANMNTLVLGITCDTGCVIDLVLEWTLPTGFALPLVYSVSTAAVGTPYRLSLNRTNGSSSLVTMNFTTTT
jgi:hypothetical protein